MQNAITESDFSQTGLYFIEFDISISDNNKDRLMKPAEVYIRNLEKRIHVLGFPHWTVAKFVTVYPIRRIRFISAYEPFPAEQFDLTIRAGSMPLLDGSISIHNGEIGTLHKLIEQANRGGRLRMMIAGLELAPPSNPRLAEIAEQILSRTGDGADASGDEFEEQ